MESVCALKVQVQLYFKRKHTHTLTFEKVDIARRTCPTLTATIRVSQIAQGDASKNEVGSKLVRFEILCSKFEI